MRELKNPATTHARRIWIGDRLGDIGDPRIGVLVRPDGIPDIAWCFVEKGGQIMITEDGNNATFDIKPFYVAKYLTTYAQYQAFVNDTETGYNNPEWWKDFPEEYRPQKLGTPSNRLPNAPRSNVSWYQSVAFARWLDAQYRHKGLFEAVLGLNPAGWKITLASEWVWQWMAQNGSEAREYPWGNEWDAGRANTSEAEGITRRTSSVGMYPHGEAACGASDLAGNLWEWCLNDYDNISEVNGYSSDKSKVLRGGSFTPYRGYARAIYRLSAYPSYVYDVFGLRLFVCPIVS